MFSAFLAVFLSTCCSGTSKNLRAKILPRGAQPPRREREALGRGMPRLWEYPHVTQPASSKAGPPLARAVKHNRREPICERAREKGYVAYYWLISWARSATILLSKAPAVLIINYYQPPNALTDFKSLFLKTVSWSYIRAKYRAIFSATLGADTVHEGQKLLKIAALLLAQH